MAAGLGFKTFTTGEVLTAADTNGYLMQGVLVFASSAARASAVTSPQEGQYSYLKDTNSTEYYDGAAWIAAPIGDITGVTAGTGISGGGTSGTVTVTNSMATEITAKGDLIAGTGSATFDNLPVGTNGQTLVADSSTATGLKWAAVAAGGKVLQVVQDVSTTEESTTSTSYVDSALSIAITPSAATSKILVIVNAGVAFSRTSAIEGGMLINLVRTATQLGEKKMALEVDTSATENRIVPKQDSSIIYLDSPSTTSATTYKVQFKTEFASSTAYVAPNSGLSSITLIEIGA